MSTTLPAAPQGSILTQLTDPAGGSMFNRIKGFAAQPAIRKTLPWFAGVAALGGVALTWQALSPDPQRTLYSQLDDSERASIVQALDKASIPYKIDNNTGSLTVGESDLYKARMTVASDGALATPDSGDDMLGNLPIGASRTLEGERMRSAKERELMLTIKEIDGVESVRVHLAEGEKSAFIRDNMPPTASVMLKLARGRQLSDSQVQAIVNLVGASVPGLTPDAVKVIDQHGRLLTDRSAKGDSDRLDMQARMEEKLRAQLTQLLTPMVGEGNFSSQVQVELDMDQVTSARESYDKQGVLRSETEQKSQTSAGAAGQGVGVPGALSNTPPVQTQAVPGAPQGTATATGPGVQPAAGAAAAATTPPAPTNGESSATRNYELGREVAVANTAPGKLKRLSVAVALSQTAMKGMKPADLDQIKQLVSAAVGADTARGDQIAVMTRKFDTATEEALPFYETSWFSMVLRNTVALLAVLLVLLLGVRPLIKALRRDPAARDDDAVPGDGPMLPAPAAIIGSVTPLTGAIDSALLGQQVTLAQRMVEEQPESAVIALRQMLKSHTLEAAR